MPRGTKRPAAVYEELASAIAKLAKVAQKLANIKPEVYETKTENEEEEEDEELGFEPEDEIIDDVPATLATYLTILSHEIKYDFEIKKSSLKDKYPDISPGLYRRVSTYLTWFRSRWSQNAYKSIIEQYPQFSLRTLPANAKQRELTLRKMLNVKGSKDEIWNALFACLETTTTPSDLAFNRMLIESIVSKCGWRGRPNLYKSMLPEPVDILSDSIEIIGVEECDPVSQIPEGAKPELDTTQSVSPSITITRLGKNVEEEVKEE